MKQLKKLIYIGLLLSTPLVQSTLIADNCDLSSTKTCFVPLSQNTLYTQYHKVFYNEDECDWSADLSLTYRYMQTKNENKIANTLLNAKDGILLFQGNDFGSSSNTYIEARNSTNALVATYFGFSPDANFTTKFSPRIQNNVFDLQFAIGTDKLWFQANAPLVWSKWQINKKGTPNIVGTLGTKNLQNGGTALLYQPVNGSGYGLGALADNATSDVDLYNYMFGTITANGEINLDTAINPIIASQNTLGNKDIDIGTCASGKITSTNSQFKSNLTNKWERATFTQATEDPGDICTISTNKISPASNLTEGLGGYTFGDLESRTYNKLKFNDKCQSQWKVADINLQAGYDFYKHDNKHFGLYVKAIIPTGTKLDDSWLQKNNFAPIIGNGRHFELGGGISGHLQLWECEDCSFTAYIDGYMTHVFSKLQKRSFDLSNHPMSRYALVKELTYDTSMNPGLPSTVSATGGDVYAYNGVLKSLGDANVACVDISADIKGEAVLDLIYAYNNWEFGAGYAFAGQTREKVKCCKKSSVNDKFYGYLGNAGVTSIAFYKTPGSQITPAYIGHTNATDGTVIFAKTNGRVAKGAFGGAYSYGQAGIDNAISSDLFTLPDINSSGLMNGQMLHRIFGHVDYVWSNNEWLPQLGILGSFGFSQDSYRTAEYWDLGARFGFSF
jgi:hypothetical protein